MYKIQLLGAPWNDKSKYQDNVRFAGKKKYSDSVMFWIAISNRGISKPLFCPSKSEAANSDIYMNECKEKRLLPFIREHNLHTRIFFSGLF